MARVRIERAGTVLFVEASQVDSFVRRGWAVTESLHPIGTNEQPGDDKPTQPPAIIKVQVVAPEDEPEPPKPKTPSRPPRTRKKKADK